MTTPVDLANKEHRKRVERIIGQAIKEGADIASIDTYVRDVCLASDPEKLRFSVQGRKKSPTLGELDWKELGGRNAFRALFNLPPIEVEEEPVVAPFELPPPCTLAKAEEVIRRWFGVEYDMASAHAVLACAAVNLLDGDPLWMLIVAGPGFTKTETVSILAGAGAFITSTISSEGALLSGTSKKEATKDATGGLLKKLGANGVLVMKDFTSILSMNRDARAAMLAALREVHDGKWERNLGTDGGKTLTWDGRIILVGAVTTAWDSHHAVIASMGDRFALLRVDSGNTDARLVAGRQSLDNLGDEFEMRRELAQAAGGVIAGAERNVRLLEHDEQEHLLSVANFVTLARTACEYDYHGRLEMAHAPEAPTRFLKQLAQVMRGALSIGLDTENALALAMRVASDSMPPMRLDIVRVLDCNALRGAGGGLSTKAIAQALDQPYSSVDKQLQSLHALRVLTRVSQPTGKTSTKDGSALHKWVYTLALALPDALKGATRLAPPTTVEDDEVPF